MDCPVGYPLASTRLGYCFWPVECGVSMWNGDELTSDLEVVRGGVRVRPIGSGRRHHATFTLVPEVTLLITLLGLSGGTLTPSSIGRLTTRMRQF